MLGALSHYRVQSTLDSAIYRPGVPLSDAATSEGLRWLTGRSSGRGINVGRVSALLEIQVGAASRI